MSTRSVLIVEHNKDLRDLLTYLFEKESFKVYATKTAKKGYKTAKKKKPSFIILGNLKKLERQIHFCGKVRGKEKVSHTPIFMLTTDPYFEKNELPRKVRANAFIITPIKPKKLVSSVYTYLKKEALMGA
ncbi:MAG: response regulator [Bacteroidota bacterium]